MKSFQFLYGPEKRLGLFIHWGLYALTEYHEQALMRLPMTREAYEALLGRFHPRHFDADAIVREAKAWGISYLCVTAKHHDGFCLWDTRETDYNVMRTPYGQDIIGQFSEACRKNGVGLALYYSVPDWHHPNAYNPLSTHQLPPRPGDQPDMPAYIEFIRRQIRELMTGYGEIAGLFWDIPPCIEEPSLNAMVRRLQPGIRINNRGFDPGDFATPEREVPAGGYDRMTEACQSVGSESWGYRRNEDYYTVRYLLSSIDQVLSRGGNFLLNIGPTADGLLPKEAKDILNTIGSWYSRVKEAFQGSFATDFLSARKDFHVTRKGNSLYLHFPDYPKVCGLYLAPLDMLPLKAELMNTGETLPASLDISPSRFQEPDGQKKYLHIRHPDFDRLSGEIPIIKLTFPDLDAAAKALGIQG